MATVSILNGVNVRNCTLMQVRTQAPRTITIQMADNANYNAVVGWGGAVRITDDNGNSYNTIAIIALTPATFQVQYSW